MAHSQEQTPANLAAHELLLKVRAQVWTPAVTSGNTLSKTATRQQLGYCYAGAQPANLPAHELLTKMWLIVSLPRQAPGTVALDIMTCLEPL